MGLQKDEKLKKCIPLILFGLVALTSSIYGALALGSRAAKWWLEARYLETIREEMYVPKQKAAARLRLREWVEQHPYDKRALGLAARESAFEIIESGTDGEYLHDVLGRYLGEKPNDLDIRMVAIVCLRDPREKLTHVNYLLEHPSAKEYKERYHLEVLKQQLIARIEGNEKKEDQKSVFATGDINDILDTIYK